MLHEEVGDYYEARRSLGEIVKIGSAVGGQAVTAMTDDRIAAIDCKLGEYDTAAEALARSAVFRRGRGTVPSVIERIYNRSTQETLSEKLSKTELKRAFLKVTDVS